MDKPETLATLGYKTQDEDKQNKTEKTTQKAKKMSNTDPTENQGARES